MISRAIRALAVCLGAVTLSLALAGGYLVDLIDSSDRSALEILTDRLDEWRTDVNGGRWSVEREAIAEAGQELNAARRLDERYHSLDREDIDGHNATAQARNTHRIRAAEILNTWGR